MDLPKGTKIDVTITYDNSADNPHNPCNPPRRVQWGMQSYDEMGAVVFQTMTASDEDEKALDDFNAAIAKAVVNQIQQSDTVKRLQEQARQYKAGVAPPGGCASSGAARCRIVVHQARGASVSHGHRSAVGSSGAADAPASSSAGPPPSATALHRSRQPSSRSVGTRGKLRGRWRWLHRGAPVAIRTGWPARNKDDRSHDERRPTTFEGASPRSEGVAARVGLLEPPVQIDRQLSLDPA